MTGSGHEDQFPVPGASARYGFRKETITGTRRNGQDAPIPAVPAPTIGWPKSTDNGCSLRLTLSICLALLFEIQ